MTESPEEPSIELKKQNYVCCLYDNEAWVGLVEDISEEHVWRCLHLFHAHSWTFKVISLAKQRRHSLLGQ